MYPPSSFVLRQMKIDSARKIKEESQFLSELKLKQAEEKSNALKKKAKDLNDLEQSFFDELQKRNKKHTAAKKFTSKLSARTKNKSPDPVFPDALDISASSVETSEFSFPKLPSNPPVQENFSIVCLPPLEIKPIMQINSPSVYSTETKTEDTPKSYVSTRIKVNNFREGSRKKQVKKTKNLPWILRPIDNGVMTVHIVGEQGSKAKIRSQNNTPIRGIEESVYDHKQNPSAYILRDLDTVDAHVNLISNSKLKIMRDYERNTVKRDFSPKPSLNQKLKIESNRIKSSLQAVNRVHFVKLFGLK